MKITRLYHDLGDPWEVHEHNGEMGHMGQELDTHMTRSWPPVSSCMGIDQGPKEV